MRNVARGMNLKVTNETTIRRKIQTGGDKSITGKKEHEKASPRSAKMVKKKTAWQKGAGNKPKNQETKPGLRSLRTRREGRKKKSIARKYAPRNKSLSGDCVRWLFKRDEKKRNATTP